jgi:hypothetical protein
MDTLPSFDAIEEALGALHERAAQTDTASPEGSRARAAITTLEMIRDQRGLEHYGADARPNGRLTDLVDTIVFG